MLMKVSIQHFVFIYDYSMTEKHFLGSLRALIMQFFLFKTTVKFDPNQNSKFQKNIKMAKICVQSPEVVMTGE